MFEVEGSVFDDESKIFGFGTNRQGLANSTIEEEFKNRFPLNFDVYQYRCLERSLMLGGLSVFKSKGVKEYVFNLIVRDSISDDISLDAVRSAAVKTLTVLDSLGLLYVAVPQSSFVSDNVKWDNVIDVLDSVEQKFGSKFKIYS